MKVRYVSVVVGLVASGAVGFVPVAVPAAHAAEPAHPPRPTVSEKAGTALDQMNRTLLAKDVSFEARILRVYQDENGDFLHIAHTMKIVARRPDRLVVETAGDDGSTAIFYDGKTAALVDVDANKYARIEVPDNIPAMIEELVGRLQVDFPLVDFLTEEPKQAFLNGATSGREVDKITIDGVPCRHLFFTQAGGLELELWLEDRERAVPRRLVVTYRAQPGQPNFIVEFSNWKLGTGAPDSAFAFRPPAGMSQVELRTAADAAPGTKGSVR